MKTLVVMCLLAAIILLTIVRVDNGKESVSSFFVKTEIQNETEISTEVKQMPIQNAITSSQKNLSNQTKTTNKTNDSPFCILPDLNPFEPYILNYIDLWKDLDSKCFSEESFSKLEEGKIVSLVKGNFCWGRCLLRKSDYLNSYTDWLPADETVFTCDFVYTGCGPWPEVHNFSQTTIHKQIVKIQNKKPNSKNIPHNVFIIAFDSTGMGQAYRNFPKSLTFLTKGLEGVVFPYLNKVGLNTRPNAIPLLFGKSIEPQDKTVFGLGMTPGDWGFEESCNRYLDNESALLTEFDQAGYRTFYGEDWKTSVLRYPDCLGFKNKTADHMFHSSWILIEMKFAWVWSNDLSHDHQDGTIPFDTDLYSFLWKNKETFDNSFVFFMSDHGLRFGRLTNAPHGRVDLNNPMFAMSVPKDLRGNGILEMMKENAKNLQTHFDTRATLLDLLKYQQPTNFTSRENKPIPGEKGSSYFREQIGERSCRTLPIPFQYCICEQTLVPLDATTDESEELGEATISYINQVLTEAGVLAHCGLWTYWNVTEISAYAPKEETNTFKIQVSAIEPYDRAVFRTMIMKRNHNEFFVDREDRVDTYGHRGDCMQNDIQALCDCIQPTKENKESEARFNDYA